MSARRKLLAVSLTLLALIGLGVSAYLTWVTWESGTVAGCTADALLDCDNVLASRWSKWFGVPVSLLGAFTYLALLVLCWPAARNKQGTAMAGLFALALLAAGAAVWFIGLQAIQIQSFCFYCLTVHTCGLVIGGIAFALTIDASDSAGHDQLPSVFGVVAADAYETTGSVGGWRLLAALSGAALGISVLMGGQLLSVPSDTMVMEELVFQPLATQSAERQTPVGTAPVDVAASDEQQPGTSATATDPTIDDEDWLKPKNGDSTTSTTFLEEPPQTIASILGSGPRQIRYQAFPEPLDVTSMPIVGSPQAEHVIVELMDYTCTHCRKLHPHLRAAVEHYGGQISVIIQHVPLSKKCNPHVLKDHPGKKYACDYAELAIGVWNLAPEKFSDFHDWLLEGEKPPSVSKARNRAMRLVGDEVLLNKKVRADITKRLVSQSAILQGLKGGLPVLLFTDGALRGVPAESQVLFEYLENHLGIEPRPTTP